MRTIIILTTLYLTLVQCMQETPDTSFLTDEQLLSLLLQGGANPETGPTCTCVDQSQCRSQNPGPTEPEYPDFDPSLIQPKVGCPGQFEVCCTAGDVISGNPNPLTDPGTSPGTGTDPGTGTGTGISPGRDPGTGVGNDWCGFVNTTDLNFLRTYGGRLAREGEFPWFVAVLKNGQYDFAGSLIHPSVVLTTAHRLNGFLSPRDLSVRVGDAYLGNNPPFEEKVVQEIIIHPRFERRRLHYDVALLFLESPITLGLGVGTMCLPMSNKEYTSDCISGGWAPDPLAETTPTPGQERLKRVNVPLWEHSECDKTFKGTKLGPRFTLDESFVCAGGASHNPQDTCVGDGGSPLVCPVKGSPNQYVQVGITAWGLECSMVGIPGVYASTLLPSVSGWIRQMVTLQFGQHDDKYFYL